MSVIFADTIFCDDIRQESNGKLIFIGVYPGDLIPATLPATFALSAFIRIHGLGTGRREFNAKITGPDGTMIFEQHDFIDPTDGDAPVTLIFGGLVVHLIRTGTIKAQVTIDGKVYAAGGLKVLHPPTIDVNIN